MIDSSSQPEWVSVAKASRMLGITETAVRKRIRVGALPARGQRGATEVGIGVEERVRDRTGPERRELGSDAGMTLAHLIAEVAELRARLADALQERDRWYTAAQEAREDARAATAAREAVERELRMVLARS